MHKAKRDHLPRDMDASPFSVIMAGLLRRLPGAFAACLVDKDGEAVDYSGAIDPYDIKVAAAHWQIVFTEFGRQKTLRGTRHVVLVLEKSSAILRALPEGYVLVVLLGKYGGFYHTERALSACENALAREAGWKLPQEHSWFAVTVTSDATGRPARIVYGGLEENVEVVGSLRGHGRERGYRVRLASGPEITIVREPGDFWYVEEHFRN